MIDLIVRRIVSGWQDRFLDDNKTAYRNDVNGHDIFLNIIIITLICIIIITIILHYYHHHN